MIIDKGEANDIQPERPNGPWVKELAKAAKKVAYGMDVVYSGPTINHRKFKDETRIRIKFLIMWVSGLMVKDKYGYVKGFAVAGADKQFHWVKGFQDGDQIVIGNR